MSIQSTNCRVCDVELTTANKNKTGGFICKDCKSQLAKQERIMGRRNKDNSDLPATKVCKDCGVEKPASCYNILYGKVNRLYSVCKECKNTRSRGYAKDRAVTAEHKVCCSCNKEKPATDYHKSKLSSDGLRSYCRACHNNRQVDASEAAKMFVTVVRVVVCSNEAYSSDTITYDHIYAECTKLSDAHIVADRLSKLKRDYIIAVVTTHETTEDSPRLFTVLTAPLPLDHAIDDEEHPDNWCGVSEELGLFWKS